MTTAATAAVLVVPMQRWFQFLFLISAMTLWPVMMAEAAVTVTPAFLLSMKTHVLDTEKPSVNKDAILIVLEDPKSPDRQD